ncbi:terminase small subunit [Parabacteroides chongii]|nr:terminase small subunit [Parabacteroides chongii]WFE87228.1 terminase small subunit [Parabacteroides chongii]
MPLTIKQENFCNYYLECGNASEAYRRFRFNWLFSRSKVQIKDSS